MWCHVTHRCTITSLVIVLEVIAQESKSYWSGQHPSGGGLPYRVVKIVMVAHDVTTTTHSHHIVTSSLTPPIHRPPVRAETRIPVTQDSTIDRRALPYWRLTKLQSSLLHQQFFLCITIVTIFIFSCLLLPFSSSQLLSMYIYLIALSFSLRSINWKYQAAYGLVVAV